MSKVIDPRRYHTDKPTFDSYFRNYERIFAPLVAKPIRLLELGVNRGGSLELWRDYFSKGTVCGIDIDPVQINDRSGRIRVYQGFQQDTKLLDRVRAESAPDGFDIIIDDCSHIGEFTALSFWHLFDHHLKAGGIFVIEDWGTGYMRGWPDGAPYRPKRVAPSIRSRFRPALESLLTRPDLKAHLVRKFLTAALNRMVRTRFPSHQHGLVGFVKQLVDEVALPDITYPTWGTPPARESPFAGMQVYHGQVFIFKAAAAKEGPKIIPRRRRTRRAHSARKPKKH
ncbi:MAG TPA: class I SAM-dependent methyltransferase [Bacteroidota bacterium]|nr:class I SAM-dependent methyltransferase [Bacteroidota bacterium]